MRAWKASVSKLGTNEIWQTDVRALDEAQALKRALDIFLDTEEREQVEFDYSTLVAEEVN